MLFSRSVPGPPAAPPLVILHGLLGSSRNWATVARELSTACTVVTPDLRNHGASPHDPVHTYEAMAADVAEFLRANFDGPVRLMGHSMGGKTAMLTACRHPELVSGLLIVDIVPKDYTAGRHDMNFAALEALDLSTLDSREQADQHLAPTVPDWAFRKFLLSNLERSEAGVWRWACNLRVLHAALRTLEHNPLQPVDYFGGPTLFLFGGRSHYYEGGDHLAIDRHFPAAQVEFIADSGHNPHFDQRELFCDFVKRFLRSGVLS